jgi:hypothetical protein
MRVHALIPKSSPFNVSRKLWGKTSSELSQVYHALITVSVTPHSYRKLEINARGNNVDSS